MTQTVANQVTATKTNAEAEPEINISALSIAMEMAEASIETFASPHNVHAHGDQAAFHRAEIEKLRRDGEFLVAGRAKISNSISVARAELKRMYEAADAQLKDRERENTAAKNGELADIKKSVSAHQAALNVLLPGAADNVETFRAAGSAKVS